MAVFRWQATTERMSNTTMINRLLFGQKEKAVKHGYRTRLFGGKPFYVRKGVLARFDARGERVYLPGVRKLWGGVRVSDGAASEVRSLLRSAGVDFAEGR